MVTDRYALALAGLLAGLLSGVTGCSGSGGEANAGDGVAAGSGASVTAAAGVPASSVSVTAPPGKPGEKVPAATVVQLLDRTLQGRFTARVHTSVTGRIGIPGAPGRTGDGRLAGTTKALITEVTIREGGRSLTVLDTDRALYLRGLMTVGGKTWLKTTAAGSKQSAATLGGVYVSVTDAADPRRLPEVWRRLASPTVAGPTSVGGVPVTSYRTTVAPDVAFTLLPLELQTDRMRQAFRKLTSVQTLSLDGAGRPVRVRTEVIGVITEDGARTPIRQVTTVRYSAWGLPLTISVPGPSSSFTVGAPAKK